MSLKPIAFQGWQQGCHVYWKVLLCLFLLSPCFAEEILDGVGAPVVTENMRTQLISEFASISPGQTFTLAMRQQIRPGWHTYWINPGDSGEPTTLEWQLPEGWQVSEIQWPAPERIPVGPLVNFGYSGDLWLLNRVTAPATLLPDDEVRLVADAYWLVCEEYCIPEQGQLEIVLPVSEQAKISAYASRLTQAEAALPRPFPWLVTTSVTKKALKLELAVPEGSEVTTVTYFPKQAGVIDHAASQRLTRGDDHLLLSIPRGFAADSGNLNGLLVLTEASSGIPQQRAYFLPDQPHVTQPAGDASGSAIESSVSLWLALAMALAGGLILNLMPCVFPVLSIKVLSLLQLAEEQPEAQRKTAAIHGVIYAAGVIAGFLLLAILLIALRAGGVVTGWGFHLQNPAVVLGLAWLFFVIGLNLSGMFEFGSGLMGLGNRITSGRGRRQSFLTGLLATIVATPCTAPFMGVAMGFALVQPAIITIAVFLALGLGMAVPVVLLCLFPTWLRWLPAPGTWMLRFKELLAFPMYLSSAWLLWVVTQQLGGDALLLGAGGAVLLSFVIWLQRLESRKLIWSGRSVGVVAMAMLLLALFRLEPESPLVAPSEGAWRVYSREAVQQARKTGPVLVNFTADWCITCKANEQVALSTDRVEQLFAEKGVIRFKADWTRRDTQIAEALAAYGRSGVPLYLWWSGPTVEQPDILPQLLSEQMLLQRLQSLPVKEES